MSILSTVITEFLETKFDPSRAVGNNCHSSERRCCCRSSMSRACSALLTFNARHAIGCCFLAAVADCMAAVNYRSVKTGRRSAPQSGSLPRSRRSHRDSSVFRNLHASWSSSTVISGRCRRSQHAVEGF